jgi:hypothetical protein
MTEQERIQPSQQAGDPLPASLPFILTCIWCDGMVWRPVMHYDDSIVYRCATCNAAMRIVYDMATMTWMAVPEKA